MSRDSMGRDKTSDWRFDLEGAAPPVATQRDTRRIFHGRALDDPYDWLAAKNWREVLRDPDSLPIEIAKLIKAENAYCERLMAPLKSLRKTLVAEMRGRIKEDDSDAPEPDGPFAYYERFHLGAEHPRYCRTPRDGGTETVLLDGDALAKGHDFFEIGDATHAPDHAQLAWSVDDTGSELYEIRTRALSDGLDRADVVGDSDGSIVWRADSKAYYYVLIDENHRTSQIFRHDVGTDPANDALIIEETDSAWFVGLHESRCRRFAIVSIHGHDATECWLIDLRENNPTPRIVAPREPRLRYDVEPHGDLIYIRDNADGADDFRISVAPLAEPGRENWKDVVCHRDGVMIDGFTVYANHLVWLLRENSLPKLVIRALSTGEEHAIQFEEEAYALSIDPGLEFDTDTLRFVYSSMTTPDETYDYDMTTRTRILRKRQDIPSGHDPKRYVTKRIFATARDGESVPITLLHRADFSPGGKGAPLLLYGYGAYGYALSASFSEDILSLVDRGFVYARAHIRGGTDKGWRWYENGKLENKQNSFLDFIDCARSLISAGYTHEGAIVAQGGSAGGLLMGAVANAAPELFAGVVASVPFVDALNTMLRDDLPLTPPEWLEWGNPIASVEAYERIASYSPYDNVRAQHYPPILAIAGVTDPRVTYWEPLKWVAKLRATMSGGGPVLLFTHMGAGHAGASGRFEALEDAALEYAFALACVAPLLKNSDDSPPKC
ncbi:S9 family peptidase [Methylocystis sp.]|uniref:S9 family peptidase n=1 Tax=Methylocystis sp. TaxID=1911079 RepID=UPI003D0F2166